MKIAVFPGSFDPITLGHYDIIERASRLFDNFIKKTFENFPNVEVDSFDGLTVEYCQKRGVNFIVRGLRNPADFEFEKAIAHINRRLTAENKIETVFLLTSSSKSFISSSIVREIISYGGDYTLFVPEAVRVEGAI